MSAEITEQCCAFCSEWFPEDEPMVSYDGQDYCSPDCVREMLNNDGPCDHAAYVAAHERFDAMLGRIMAKGEQGD